jgi:hypothetical protein
MGASGRSVEDWRSGKVPIRQRDTEEVGQKTAVLEDVFRRMKMRRFAFALLVLSLSAGALIKVPAANAQSVAGTSCGSYRDAEKDPAQQAAFKAYLQGYANAISPDPRYTKSDAALDDDAKQVSDWCNKNSRSSYAEAVASVLGSPGCSGNSQASGSPQPTSCRVGPTIYCAGCGVFLHGRQAGDVYARSRQ